MPLHAAIFVPGHVISLYHVTRQDRAVTFSDLDDVTQGHLEHRRLGGAGCGGSRRRVRLVEDLPSIMIYH